MRRSHRISVESRDVIIGGFSAGGSIAARLAFRYPEAFGTVLLHSAALRSNGPLNPTILEYRDGARRALRFYQDVGLYDNVRDLPLHELAQSEGSVTIANRHFRDVLIAKGYEVMYRETGGQHDAVRLRATFPEALQELLAP
jgi:enterochelin esterase family protein